ncbi:MAG: hypothetical protein ACI304_01330 [Lepagella sp.]
MKKLLLLLLFVICTCMLGSYAQDDVISTISVPNQEDGTNRVYAELVGTSTNILGANKNVKVALDLGQYQSAFKSYYIQDENNKDIKFNSMVGAMNYMGERGWKFIQAYVISHGNQNVYHWLMYKDLKPGQDLMEGLNVKNTD